MGIAAKRKTLSMVGRFALRDWLARNHDRLKDADASVPAAARFASEGLGCEITANQIKYMLGQFDALRWYEARKPAERQAELPLDLEARVIQLEDTLARLVSSLGGLSS